jgi:hypothetical protein
MAASLTGPCIKNDRTYPILLFCRAHISLESKYSPPSPFYTIKLRCSPMMLFKLAIIWATLTSATQAQNSACTAATSISALPASVSGDTSNVSPVQDVAAESCQLARGPLASSWYSYVAESDGCLTAKVTPPAADEWDTILTAHSGDSCSALSCVAMNDDVDVVAERGSEVRINAVTGTTYYFMVAGYDNDEPGGRFEFALSVRLRDNAD